MKSANIIRISAILAILTLAAPLQAQVQTFTWQNQQRQYLILSPADAGRDLPVVFFLHGLGDNITRLNNEFHFQQIADRYNWIMVVPQALSQNGSTMWNAALTNSSIDDVGFLMALLDSLATQYPIALDSLFFTGFSMGGFMTHRMAIERGDRINACAPVSGLITYALANQTPVAPVKLLHIHGTADPVVGYDGGSDFFGNLGLGVEAILAYWAEANGCEASPVIDSLPDLHSDGLRFVRYRYEGDAPLQHIKVIGGDHTWYLDAGQTDICYFDELYRFFTGNDYSPVGLTSPGAEPLQLWPNPTSGSVTLTAGTDSRLLITDASGRLVARHLLASGQATLDLRQLPAGIYFVRELASGTIRKLVITR